MGSPPDGFPSSASPASSWVFLLSTGTPSLSWEMTKDLVLKWSTFRFAALSNGVGSFDSNDLLCKWVFFFAAQG